MTTIRRLEPSELAEATDVWYRSLAGSIAYMRAEQRRREEDDRGFFREVVALTREVWVAVSDERLVGVMALGGSEVDRLYVAPEAQGRGIGAALLEHAKSLHPDGLTLVTHQRNTGACRFYERHGFVAGKLGLSPPPESEPDVIYAWSGSSAQ
jgi:ribosomal protein S18 acetylase RimI-like enzyme